MKFSRRELRDAWRVVREELPLCRAIAAWALAVLILALADDGELFDDRF